MGTRIWIDDLRLPPEGWVWVKTSDAAIEVLAEFKHLGSEYEVISFDHDLGGDDTSRRIMMWMIENESFPTDEVFVHTANSVGRQYLVGTAQRYFPSNVKVRF